MVKVEATAQLYESDSESIAAFVRDAGKSPPDDVGNGNKLSTNNERGIL